MTTSEGGTPGSMDAATVDGFGLEWSTYDQSERDPASLQRTFDRYFDRFPWGELSEDSVGIDVGCGSGRWASLVAGRGPAVLGLDASVDALGVAAGRLERGTLVNGSAVELPFRGDSVDFSFSLGVLHHLPDTQGAIAEIHRVLRPGAPFLVYLYYAFDNRPAWFRLLWRVSDGFRSVVARLPHRPRLAVTRAIASLVYWPMAKLSAALERRGMDVGRIPLSAYRAQPFYVMKTDALDRFGTRLEKRYTRGEIESLLVDSGFSDVEFNDDWPFWCALARA